MGPKIGETKTDEELMTAYRLGDLESFDKLYTRYETKLFGYLLKLTRDRGVAEEVFQETFLNVVRSAANFEEKSFSGWIFTIARRQWIDRCRREGRRPQAVVQEETENVVDRLASPEASPETLAYDDEFQGKLTDLLATIPPEQAEVFLLRVQGELEYHEIAEVVGVPMETAKSRMRYAVAAVSRKLKGGNW